MDLRAHCASARPLTPTLVPVRSAARQRTTPARLPGGLFQHSARHSGGHWRCKNRRSTSLPNSNIDYVVEDVEQGAKDASKDISEGVDEAEEKAEEQASAAKVEDVTLGTVLRFALPTLAIWLIGPSLSLIDTAVVGSKSSTQLAALGPAVLITDVSGYLFTFLAVATTNLMAVSIAGRNQQQATEILSDAVGIALIIGALFGLITYFACPSILLAITKSPEVTAAASTYAQIRCFGAPAAFVMFVTNAFFLAAWNPLTPLRSALAAGSINLVLDLFLVNVVGWGIAGAAVATVCAQVIVAALLVSSVSKPLPEWSPIHGWKLQLKWRVPSLKAVARFFIFAGPIVFVLLTKVTMYNCLGAYSSGLGATQSAANHLCMTVFGLFAVFGDVISQAAQAFLPGNIGKPAKAQDLGKKLFTAGAGVGVVNSVLAVSIVVFLPWIFTKNPDVISLAARLSPLLAGAICIHTASLPTEGMLVAGRDLSFLVWSYLLNIALVLTSLRYVSQNQIGVLGSFACLIQFQLFRLVINAVRLTRAGSSPLQRTDSLASWITDDVKAAIA